MWRSGRYSLLDLCAEGSDPCEAGLGIWGISSLEREREREMGEGEGEGGEGEGEEAGQD